MKKILVLLLLVAFLFISLLQSGTLASIGKDGFDGEYVYHNGKKFKGDVDWTPFFRDKDHNGVDDLIDESKDEKVDIFIKLESIPTDEDVKIIENFVPHILYKAKYTNTIIVRGVEKELIYSKLRYLDRVTFIEYIPKLRPFLDVSTKNIKVKPNDLYHNVWEELGYTGRGVNIAILDGGSNDGEVARDMAHESLDDMDDNLTTYDPKFVAGWDWETMSGGELVNPHGDPIIGHGTHVAGTALGTGGQGNDSDYRGVAPGAQLIDVKVMTDTGFGSFLVPAMEWCIDNKDRDWLTSDTDGIQIMSLSLGGTESDGTDTFSQTANQAVEAGIVVVVAVGNDGRTGYITTPAAADKVIAVGATDDKGTVKRDDDSVAGYSNRGPRDDDGDNDSYDELKPDVVAPGTNIMAPRVDSYNGYISMSGTSMATPHVSGVVALMLEANPDLTPDQVKMILHKSAEARGSPYDPSLSEKYNVAYGYGIVDAYKAVLMAKGYCDLEVEDLEVKNLEEGKERYDEGDRVEVTIKLKENEGFDVESYTVVLKDDDSGTTIKSFTGTMPGGGRAEHKTQFRLNDGGFYNLSAVIQSTEPEDIELSNNEKNVSFYVNYLPRANIEANETEVLTYEEIRFDGTESSDKDGAVKQYKFIFGDGNETEWQDDPIATHTYTDDGTYTVQLVVKDNHGAESGPYSDDMRIKVYNRAPVADAGEDLSGETGQEIHFKGTGRDKDGRITLYEWDFDGDGSYDWSSEETGETTHVYDEPGSYQARFRVTDDDDVVDVDSITVDITGGTNENQPPVARITEPQEGEVYFTDQDILFNGADSSDPDGTISSYKWQSNISGTLYEGTKSKVRLRIDKGGHHRITLSVKDNKGATNETSVKIFVDNPPEVFINSPEDGATYQQNEIVLDASSTKDKDGDELTYKWTSDKDGVLYQGKEKKVTTTLSTGEHTITLEVSDPYTSRSSSVHITIEESANSKPKAVIDEPKSTKIYSSEEMIRFNATSSSDPDGDELTYIWTSDLDGELYRGEAPTFEKKLSFGEHNITLKLSDGELYDTASVKIKVNAPPVAEISFPKNNGVFFVGDTITLDGTGSFDPDSEEENSLTYTWYINGEEVSTEVKFETQFETNGAKDITLVVKDNYGFQSDDSITIYIISHSIKTKFVGAAGGSFSVNPGESIIVKCEIENKASIPDKVSISPTQGKYVTLTINGPTEFTLEKNEKKVIDLNISVSEDAEEGKDEVGLLVTAGEGKYATTTEEVVGILIGEVLSFDITFSKSSVKIDAAEKISVTLTITNTGNAESSLKIDVVTPKNWEVTLSNSLFTLKAGEKKEVKVTIKAPETIKNQNETITFNFESLNGEFKETQTLYITAGKMSAKKDGGSDDSSGFEAGVFVITVGVISFLTFRKRKHERG